MRKVIAAMTLAGAALLGVSGVVGYAQTAGAKNAGAQTAGVQNAPGGIVADTGTANGWSGGTGAMSANAVNADGKKAVVWQAPAGGTVASLTYRLGANGVTISGAKTLRFFYRFDGDAPDSLMVKIAAPPLASGWQAIYTLPVGRIGEWQEARIAVQEFENEWGDAPAAPDASYLQWRIGKKDGAVVRVSVADVRAVPLPAGEKINVGKRTQAEANKPEPMITKQWVENLPAHPRLLLSASEVGAMKRRMSETEWGRAYRDALLARCDAAVAKPLALPDRGGQWHHWYSCPKHGARLRNESPTRHVCPVDNEVFTGYPYDDVVLSNVHDAYAASVRDLGVAYLATGEKKYAAKAREILLAYAAKYKTYPLHTKDNEAKIGGGRIGPQTLDEATWLIPAAQGCDAIWDTLSPADRETLKVGLFYPAAKEVILPHKMAVHNIQCWKNSAVGLVGLLFSDYELVAEAVDNGDRGLQRQISEGITPDGPWYEGAWGYHFYTMSALAPLTEALYHNGLSVYTGKLGEQYKKFFLAPLQMAMPDGKLPAFNDSNTATALGNAHYETALARWKDPRFALVLAASNRRTIQAATVGMETLPKADTGGFASENFTDSGYAVLRQGEGATQTWLCLKYGPHGGGHGHPDKLNFVLYGGGRILADDPGTANYGVPVQAGWYKTTLAHNTLVVDEENQKPATGKCLAFVAEKDWSAVLADAGPIYEGVSFRRAAFLLPDGVAVFLDMANSTDDKIRQFDFAFHPNGKWATTPGQAYPVNAEKPGYSYLRDITWVSPVNLFLHPNGGATTLALYGDNSGFPLLGTGVGRNTEDRVPVIFWRSVQTRATVRWAITPQNKPDFSISRYDATDMEGKPVYRDVLAALVDGKYLCVSNPERKKLKVAGVVSDAALIVRKVSAADLK